MKPLSKQSFNVFSLFIVIALMTTVYIFYHYFFTWGFPIFTTESEIQNAIDTEFPWIAEYL